MQGGEAARRALAWLGWGMLALAGLLIVAVATGPALFGWEFVVTDGSMEPAIRAGSLAVFEKVPAEGVYRGDIVLAADADGRQVARRVMSLTADGALAVTKGDANGVADTSPAAVDSLGGKYVFAIPYLGYAANRVAPPWGYLALALAPGIVVISLAIISMVRTRRKETVSRASSGRIFLAPGPSGEDELVRFPFRRHQEHPALEPIALTLPARPSDPAPPPPPDSPGPSPRVEAEVPASQPAPRPGPVAQIPLRTQATANDARTERLVRSIRGEVEELRETLETIANDRAEFLEADLAAIIADPEGASSLPAPVLVRAILMANERNVQMLAELGRQARRNGKLKSKLRSLRIEHAQVAGRLATLDEVIAALHGNLEDLRLERGGEPRRVSQPQGPQPLRAAGNEPLPPARPQLFDRD